MKKKTLTALALAAGLTLTATACSSDSDVASKNLSKDADNFKIQRRIVFVNGITDEYLLEITGKCAIKDENGQLEVTCKTDDGEFVKHFLGLSDNVTYVAEQAAASSVSTDQYRVIFRPEALIPDVDRP